MCANGIPFFNLVFTAAFFGRHSGICLIHLSSFLPGVCTCANAYVYVYMCQPRDWHPPTFFNFFHIPFHSFDTFSPLFFIFISFYAGTFLFSRLESCASLNSDLMLPHPLYINSWWNGEYVIWYRVATFSLGLHFLKDTHTVGNYYMDLFFI